MGSDTGQVALDISTGGLTFVGREIKKGLEPPGLPSLPEPPKDNSRSKGLLTTAARKRLRDKTKSKSGRSSTIVTGPRGLVDQPVLSTKTLLGQ